MSVTELEAPAETAPPVPAPAPSGGRRERRLAGQQGAAVAPPLPQDDEEVGDAHRRPPLSTGRGTAVWILATVSLLAAWFVLYTVALSPLEESRRQSVLYNSLRESLALQTAPLGGPIAPGTPVALLSLPTTGGVDQVVVEGTASGDLMSGPGHKRDTVLPGQIGVSVLYGRASLFGGPFGTIGSLRTGDRIVTTTGQGVSTYVVTGLRRAGDPFPQPLAAGAGRLTLVSAEGNGRWGFLAPRAVVYVDADLVGKAQPGVAGRPSVVPRSEQAMQGDPSALLPLALALPLLIGSVLVLSWARTRWGGWQSWVVGLPLLLATLWTVSQAAVQLLPNLL